MGQFAGIAAAEVRPPQLVACPPRSKSNNESCCGLFSAVTAGPQPAQSSRSAFSRHRRP
jgi:hypothetical protein